MELLTKLRERNYQHNIPPRYRSLQWAMRLTGVWHFIKSLVSCSRTCFQIVLNLNKYQIWGVFRSQHWAYETNMIFTETNNRTYQRNRLQKENYQVQTHNQNAKCILQMSAKLQWRHLLPQKQTTYIKIMVFHPFRPCIHQNHCFYLIEHIFFYRWGQKNTMLK